MPDPLHQKKITANVAFPTAKTSNGVRMKCRFLPENVKSNFAKLCYRRQVVYFENGQLRKKKKSSFTYKPS